MTLFHGLSAFPITPATPNGQIIADDLAQLLLRLKAAQVNSVGLLGSTGTYAYLDRAARQKAVSIAAETLAGDVSLIVRWVPCAPMLPWRWRRMQPRRVRMVC